MTIADGNKSFMPYAGPIKFNFGNRMAFVGAMILGDDMLLGVIPIKDLDVVIHPATCTLHLYPDSPNIAMTKAK